MIYRIWPFFKLYEGIIILNTKTKNLVYQIIDKKIPYLKLGTQEVKQSRILGTTLTKKELGTF